MMEVVVLKIVAVHNTISLGKTMQQLGNYLSFVCRKNDSVYSVRTKMYYKIEGAEAGQRCCKASVLLFINTVKKVYSSNVKLRMNFIKGT